MIVAAVLLIFAFKMFKSGRAQKATVALIILGTLILAKFWNPLASFSGDWTKGAALVLLAWILWDVLVTKNVEKLTYAFAGLLPFFALACDSNSAIGQVARMLSSIPVFDQAFNQIT